MTHSSPSHRASDLRPFPLTLADSAELIRWDIGDSGFVMHLSGEVPGRIQAALGDPSVRRRLWGSDDMAGIDRWAVHAGGRSILDAVEQGLELGRDARSEEHTSELQSLMRISYAVFCLKKQKNRITD